MPLPYDDEGDDVEVPIEYDEDDDDVDAWVREHVSEHGPTAAGFDALAQMDQEGLFT